MTTAATRVFALLGDPVSHSLSPQMQNAAMQEAGVDGIYIALRCAADDVASLVRALARAGGGGNITIPHKAEAAVALDLRTDAVQATGACNTFWLEDNRIAGDNTDVYGFRRAAESLFGDVRDTRALVIGAGGAASAVVYGLITAGAARVAVLNRSHERAVRLADRFASSSVRAVTLPFLAAESFDLIVNATSLGMRAGDPSPIELPQVGGARVVLDLVCAPHATSLLAEAARYGIPAADGREMLVQQGAAAFSRWFGADAPLQVMRASIGVTPPHRAG